MDILPYALLLVTISGVLCSEIESQLVNSIKLGYNKYVRPVKNFSDSITIEIAAYPIQVLALREKEQSLRLSLEVSMNWTDIHLTWNPDDYNGIKKIVMNMEDIWIPDITLYNNVDENFKPNDVFTRTRVRVEHTGAVVWSNPAILNVFCKVNVVAFPFDTQNCSLFFGSWTYSGSYINLINTEVDQEKHSMQVNGEWDFVRFEAHRHIISYICCPDPYIDVTYYLTIRRRAFFYTYYLVMPSAIILCLALMVFCLPAESGEKASLVVTVLLAMVVYLLLLTQLMPPTSDGVPVVGQFFGAIVGLLSLASTLTIFVLNIHHQGDTGELAPQWLVDLLLAKVGKFVFLADVCANVLSQVEDFKRTDPERVVRRESLSFRNGHIHTAGSVIPSSPLTGRYTKSTHDVTHNCHQPAVIYSSTNEVFNATHGCENLAFDATAPEDDQEQPNDSYSNDIQAIRTDIADIRIHFHYRLRLSKMKNLSKREWRTLAMVVDRCFFIFIIIATLIACSCIFVFGLSQNTQTS